MDSSSQSHNPPSTVTELDDWDTDGYVIPSLGLGDPDQSKHDDSVFESSKPPSQKAMKEENIYLGPRGAPPSQSMQQLSNATSRKHQFKQKLKEADRRIGSTGRENKLENIQELVGGSKANLTTSRSSSRDWLDPHCHESEFERRHSK